MTTVELHDEIGQRLKIRVTHAISIAGKAIAFMDRAEINDAALHSEEFRVLKRAVKHYRQDKRLDP